MTEGRPGRYLRYAAGEIVLVVIGILIALQINNWNEDRVERRQAREYALALADDLAHDMEMVAPVDDQIRVQIRQIAELAQYTRGKSLDEIDNAELYFFTWGAGYRPYRWNRATLDQIKSSGALRKMRNHALVERISAYDALSRHLDQDYTNDQDMLEAASLVVAEVCNQNYANQDDAVAYFSGVPDGAQYEERFFAFRETDVFRRMKASALPPLARDIGEIDHMVNVLLSISVQMSPRPDIELPELRRMAAEIIALIETEYGKERAGGTRS